MGRSGVVFGGLAWRRVSKTEGNGDFEPSASNSRLALMRRIQKVLEYGLEAA